SAVNHTMWAVLEGNAIVIASCIPSLRPFTKYLRQQYTTRNRRRPDPLTLHKERHLNSADATILPSPISPARMQPRSSGSVSSNTLRLPPNKIHRQNSLQPIQSVRDGGEYRGQDMDEKGKGIDWKGFDMAAVREDQNMAEKSEEMDAGDLDPLAEDPNDEHVNVHGEKKTVEG
ncbi:MAG: hypothetical protein Q9183_007270, partial [Haloplaca sp. 2 TL-2023]